MGKYKYKFTLFTPCYNSAPYIDRIKETIDGQLFRDFEWIVVNDASTDNTSDLLKEYIAILDLPVKFFDLKKNQIAERRSGRLYFKAIQSTRTQNSNQKDYRLTPDPLYAIFCLHRQR